MFKKRIQTEAVALPPATIYDQVSWGLMGLFLVAILLLHLLPALLGGLLVCELVRRLVPFLPGKLSHGGARSLAVFIIALSVTSILITLFVSAFVFFNSESGNISLLFEKLAEIIDNSRGNLPDWVWQYIPTTAEELRASATLWLKEHSHALQTAGKNFGMGFLHVIVGFIIGSLLSLHNGETREWGPLATSLFERAKRLSMAFSQIVFAQIRISALNTGITSIYLIFILPAFGIDLPLVKTMIALTFFVGLIPVLGNLISNSIIFLVSLSHSVVIALISLGYLIVIHKLEYFINARIIGGRISAQAWELLMSMLIMESAFGIPGVIAAPIIYAYLKKELSDRGLV
jgi:predicted PurR-regulated permease PerM